MPKSLRETIKARSLIIDVDDDRPSTRLRSRRISTRPVDEEQRLEKDIAEERDLTGEPTEDLERIVKLFVLIIKIFNSCEGLQEKNITSLIPIPLQL